ncbi:hypothetical protein ACIGO9_29650 [Nocardia asteroides]|uniref:hypothetical protein n=1 Tax=Nocardia asteroides TaxID=1824 RepID=UPI0037CA8DA9
MADRDDLYLASIDGVAIPADVLAYASSFPDSWVLSFQGRRLGIRARTLHSPARPAGRRVFEAQRWSGPRESRTVMHADSLRGAIDQALAHLQEYRQAGMSMKHTRGGVVAQYRQGGRWSQIMVPSPDAAAANQLFQQANRRLDGVSGLLPWAQLEADLAAASSVSQMRVQISRLAEEVRTQSRRHPPGFDEHDPSRRLLACAASLVELATAQRVLWRVQFTGEGHEPLQVTADTGVCADLLARSYSPFAGAAVEVSQHRVGVGYLPDPGSVQIRFENAISSGRQTLYVKAATIEAALRLAHAFRPYNNTIATVAVVESAHVDGLRTRTVAAEFTSEPGVPSVYDALAAVQAGITAAPTRSGAGDLAADPAAIEPVSATPQIGPAPAH